MQEMYVSDLQLAKRYNVSRSTIWRWVKAGILPMPVKLSPGCTRFEILAIEKRDREVGSGKAA